MGISEEVPIGSRWMHIVKPDRDHLVRIAAGKYAVWALGATGLISNRIDNKDSHSYLSEL